MQEILEILKEYIKPELIILIPVLNYIGYVFKKTERVKDANIPFWNLVVGIFISGLWVIGTTPSISTYHNVCIALFMSFTQGGLCAAASWVAHRIYKTKFTTENGGNK